jgi:4-amino-4-deoxy-L-arabinose transferase-like glycosyltransferase
MVSALVGGALLLRLALLNSRSLWFDEAFSVAIARLPWSEGARLIAKTDAHPPLYYLLLHLWLRLGDTPAVVRSFSVLCGVLTVLVTWLLGRTLGGRSLGAVSGVLAGASALAIQASVEARMYPLLALLTVVSTFLLWKAASGASRWWLWGAYGVTVGLGFYVDYFAFLLIPAHVLYIALYHRRNHVVRLGFLLALAGALLAYAPWWPSVAGQLAEGRAHTVWKGRMPITAPLNMLALSSFGGYLLGLGGYLVDGGRWSWWQLPLVLPFLSLAAAGAVGMPRGGAAALLLGAWAVPVAMLVGASLATGVVYAVPRYVSFVHPFFIILVAQGILTVASRDRRGVALVTLTAGIVALNLTVLGMASSDVRYQPYDWAGAARYVDDQWQPGDGLVFYPHTARVAFGYYFTQPAVKAVTLYPPPWTAKLTKAQLLEGVPPIPALVQNAERVWLILTEPTPPGSTEALLEVMERSYRRTRTGDFRHVWAVLYERRSR